MEIKEQPQSGLENNIGYTFKNPALLKEALTHSSYSNEKKSRGITIPCNERLEFLGDSVLSIVVSSFLFDEYKDIQEGALTKIRAAVVCEKALSKFAKKIHLGDFIFLGHGEALNDGRNRPSILADTFEAVLAGFMQDINTVTSEKTAAAAKITGLAETVFPTPLSCLSTIGVST